MSISNALHDPIYMNDLSLAVNIINGLFTSEKEYHIVLVGSGNK
jgi:hypothetical protein